MTTATVTLMSAEQAAGLPIHPLAGLMPMMSAAEYNGLVADVTAHGVRDAVVLLDGMILDGRNRRLACVAANRDMPVRTLPANINARDFVIGKNLRRRNLSASQAAMVAARMVTTRQGPAATADDITQAQAAVTVNVSPRYVRDAAWLIENHPDLADQVFNGDVTLAAAIRSTRPSEVRRANGNSAAAAEASDESAEPTVVVADPADPVATMLSVMEWLAREPRDHAEILARLGDRARVLIPALDDFARRLWDSADDEGRLR